MIVSPMTVASKTIIIKILIFIGNSESHSGTIEFRGRRWSIYNYDKRHCIVLDFCGMDISLEHPKRRSQTWRNYMFNDFYIYFTKLFWKLKKLLTGIL